MFKNKYRIVADCFSGYEAQVKYWLWPFYIQIGANGHGTNTHINLDSAKRLCIKHSKAKSIVMHVKVD